MEWCLISRYSKSLSTSNLQYSFKPGHSTTMCTMTMKEVIRYYWNRGSKVFGCFLDASKAFDRLRYDKFFHLLYNRGIPPIMLQLFIDLYERQKSRCEWDGEFSPYFTCTNGVRQGGIASPLMFTVYIDEYGMV